MLLGLIRVTISLIEWVVIISLFTAIIRSPKARCPSKSAAPNGVICLIINTDADPSDVSLGSCH